MATFSKYISQQPEDFGAALRISGFHVQNGAPNLPIVNNFPYSNSLALFTGGEGISSSDIANKNISVASGQFFVKNPRIAWSLVNPADNSVFSDEDVSFLDSLKGFEITLEDETGAFVQRLTTGDYKNTYYSLSTDNIKSLFTNLENSSVSYGNSLSPNRRRLRFKVVSTDYYNRKNTGIYFLTMPTPVITGCQVAVGTDINLDFKATRYSGLSSLLVYGNSTSGFNISNFSGTAAPDYKYTADLSDSFRASLNFDLDGNPNSGLYYAAVLSDNLGTGQAY